MTKHDDTIQERKAPDDHDISELFQEEARAALLMIPEIALSTPWSAELMRLRELFPDRYHVAIHEAGHCAAAMLLGRRIKMVSIDEPPSGFHEGFVWWPHASMHAEIWEARLDLVVMASGRGAEYLYGLEGLDGYDRLTMAETARKVWGMAAPEELIESEMDEAWRRADDLLLKHRDLLERSAVLMLQLLEAARTAPDELAGMVEELKKG